MRCGEKNGSETRTLANSTTIICAEYVMADQKIAYIISRFPVLTETFITREIVEVKRKGVDVVIFSLRNPKHNYNIHVAAPDLIKNTHYIPYLFSFETLKAVVYYLITSPVTLIMLVARIFRTHMNNPALLLKTLAIFPKALTISLTIKDLGVEKIHAHWATIPTTVAWIVSNLNNIDFTFTAHAWDIFKYDTMLHEKITDAKKVITCTNYNKQYLIEKFPDIDPDKIAVVYHGMDFNQFTPLKNKENRIFTILSIGRLSEKKGFQFLLKASLLLHERGIPFLCRIIYVKGDFEKQIFHIFENLRLSEYVEFIPEMPQERLIDYYNSADCFVLPCIITKTGDRDGIPNVIIEALAMELPVVTTSISGIPEVIKDRETGLIINQESAEDLASALEELYTDKKLRERLGKAGKELAYKQFEISTTISLLLKYIL